LGSSPTKGKEGASKVEAAVVAVGMNDDASKLVAYPSAGPLSLPPHRSLLLLALGAGFYPRWFAPYCRAGKHFDVAFEGLARENKGYRGRMVILKTDEVIT
jgi:hypothetical protein